MTTPISTSIPYCTAAELREGRDFRQLGDLVSDDGTRETTAATFDASTKVARCLMIASGMIESACLKGNKYSVQDLQGLSGASKYMLSDLCCELAWWKLVMRRMSRRELPPETLWALSVLDDLESGKKVFGLQEQADAGNPSNGIMTSSDWDYLNLASNQARRYFGSRARERAGGQGSGCSDPCGCD